jgi:signal transduction histidine kinase
VRMGRPSRGGEPEAPAALLGQLAHELSILVRSDVELAASRRLHRLRLILFELAALLAAAVAGFLALAALTWAAVRALDQVLPGWASALVAAGAWAGVSAALLALERSRHLLVALGERHHARLVASAEETRADAEQAVRRTAEQLARAVVREAARHELRTLEAAADEAVETAETDAGALLKDVVEALGAPARASLALLERNRRAACLPELTPFRPSGLGRGLRRLRREPELGHDGQRVVVVARRRHRAPGVLDEPGEALLHRAAGGRDLAARRG